jgi:hypothetical protein
MVLLWFLTLLFRCPDLVFFTSQVKYLPSIATNTRRLFGRVSLKNKDIELGGFTNNQTLIPGSYLANNKVFKNLTGDSLNWFLSKTHNRMLSQKIKYSQPTPIFIFSHYVLLNYFWASRCCSLPMTINYLKIK